MFIEFEEKLPNGKTFHTVYLKDYTYQNSDVFTVPEDHYFFLGDNRDCSKDSRFLSSVGYVHKDNLVGKAQFIFFSSDKKVEVFLLFGNGTNQLDLIELLIELINENNYQDLQKKIKVKFKNLDLLIQSLTHKSFDTKKNNEKIEFLGDRVLRVGNCKKTFRNLSR